LLTVKSSLRLGPRPTTAMAPVACVELPGSVVSGVLLAGVVVGLGVAVELEAAVELDAVVLA